jgi:hypothetical protein
MRAAVIILMAPAACGVMVALGVVVLHVVAAVAPAPVDWVLRRLSALAALAVEDLR